MGLNFRKYTFFSAGRSPIVQDLIALLPPSHITTPAAAMIYHRGRRRHPGWPQAGVRIEGIKSASMTASTRWLRPLDKLVSSQGYVEVGQWVKSSHREAENDCIFLDRQRGFYMPRNSERAPDRRFNRSPSTVLLHQYSTPFSVAVPDWMWQQL